MNKKNERPGVIICVGSGGVGKTTMASVIGIHHACQGKKVLVITVDPARRLLDSLSLKEKGHDPLQVDLSSLLGNTKQVLGSLWAYMPDLKQEWLDFLRASIDSSQVRHQIESNHFYQYMADGIPGALEIICSHILFRIKKSKQFDLIILDTPPASHSVSFFDVPQKISRVLEQSVFRALMNRRNSFLHRVSKRIALFSGGVIEKTLEKIIGSHVLSELIDFALSIDALYEPMLKRSRAMQQLLVDSKTQYVLVLRPTIASVNDSMNLASALRKRRIHISEIVINQVVPHVSKKLLQAECDDASQKNKSAPLLNTLLKKIVTTHLAEQSFHNKLISRIKKQFVGVDTKIIFLGRARAHRNDLIKDLLKNYQGNNSNESVRN